MKELGCFLAVAFLSTAGSAATWNFLSSDDTTLYFFDSESVVKKGTTVTVWIKQLRDQNQIARDGVASGAFRERFDCKERTYQMMQAITYAKDGSVLETHSNPGPPTEPAPDTYGAGFLKAACTPDFPEGKHPDLYTPVTNNDVATFSSNYFTYLANQKNDPAPRDSAAKWNTLVQTKDHSVWFFDANSVEKSEDSVVFWLKYVRDEAYPDADGSYSSAAKLRIDCRNRKAQVLTIVTYLKDHSVRSISKDSPDMEDIVPDSWFEYQHKVACLPEFPSAAYPEQYFPVVNNDIYSHTAKFFANSKRSSSAAK